MLSHWHAAPKLFTFFCFSEIDIFQIFFKSAALHSLSDSQYTLKSTVLLVRGSQLSILPCPWVDMKFSFLMCSGEKILSIRTAVKSRPPASVLSLLYSPSSSWFKRWWWSKKKVGEHYQKFLNTLLLLSFPSNIHTPIHMED